MTVTLEIVESNEVTILEVVSTGLRGEAGATGPAGAAGPGVPAGGTTGQVLKKSSATDYATEWGVAAGGDVVGPSSATDNAIARFDTTTGKLIQNSIATLDDTGILAITSVNVTGTNGNGHIHLKHQASDASATGSSTVLFANSSGDLKYKNDGGFYTTLTTSANTADRAYNFADASGDIPLKGTFVANSIAYASDTNTIGILDTATYPSLAELAYVKGVTSAIQTQIDAKVSGPASATDNAIVRFDLTTGKLVQDSAVTIDDSNNVSTTGSYQLSGDVILNRDAANILALRNSTNPQTFRVYGTYTDASNGDWFSVSKVAGGTTTITNAANGTGTSGSLTITASSVIIQQAGVARITTNAAGISFACVASSSAATPKYSFIGATDSSALTASTEAIGFNVNFSQTRTHATGAITLQRDFRFAGSTHAFSGASTITDCAALGIEYSTGGTNATITNLAAILVQTRALTGVTNGYGLNIAAPSGATNNWAALFTGNTQIVSGGLAFSTDTFLQRDAANTLALRNSTNAQTFRVYGTYTDASNGDWLSFTKAAGGSSTISTAANGTGTEGALVLRGGASGCSLTLNATATTAQFNGSISTNGTAPSVDTGITTSANVTNPSTTQVGVNASRSLVLTATNSTQVYGATCNFTTGANAFNHTGLGVGGQFQVQNSNTATCSDQRAGFFLHYNVGAGTVTHGSAGYFSLQNLNASGVVANGYGVRVEMGFNNGTYTNTYGLYVGDITQGTQTNQAYGIFISDANCRNYFAGPVQVDGLLRLAGATSSFPALKRSGAAVQARLADDTAFAEIDCSVIQLNTIYTVATLPTAAAGNKGIRTFVSDALAPAFGATVAAGGAVYTPVYSDGAAWKVG